METLNLRPAGMDDAKQLFDWRNDADSRAAAVITDEVEWDDHVLWLQRSLARKDRLLFIGEARRTDEAVGMVRLDQLAAQLWEISLVVCPSYRGRGWARKLLASGLNHCGRADFVARIRPESLRSRSLFEGLGFKLATTSDGLMLYRLSRRAAA